MAAAGVVAIIDAVAVIIAKVKIVTAFVLTYLLLFLLLRFFISVPSMNEFRNFDIFNSRVMRSLYSFSVSPESALRLNRVDFFSPSLKVS